MAVDFSEVRVGDLVKLTRGEDEFAQIRVDSIPSHRKYVEDAYCTGHFPGEWDTLEIVKPPLPTKLGSVICLTEASDSKYVLTSRGWMSVVTPGSAFQTTTSKGITENSHQYEVLFVPED